MKATDAYEEGIEPFSTKTPVVIVINVKTNHINAMLLSINGLLPTLAGRKANATEQPKLNMELVAVIKV